MINFKCRKCKQVFDGDVGIVSFPENSPRPSFEKAIICPKCGEITLNDVELTELGQTQMTQLDMDHW